MPAARPLGETAGANFAGTHSSASVGHTSTQIPQSMHKPKSISKLASTNFDRVRRDSLASLMRSARSEMHHAGQSRTQIMQLVQASGISAMAPRRRDVGVLTAARSVIGNLGNRI